MNQSVDASKNMSISPKTAALLDKICTEKFFYYYIISVMLIIPIAELITEILGYRFVTQPVILYIYGVVGLAAVFVNLLYKYDEKKYYPSDIFYILLGFFAFIALAFSKDIENSCMGFEYDELPMHFMAYFALMFAGTMINDDRLRKNVLLTFCIVGALQCIVALFQTFGFRIAECYYDTEWHAIDKLSYGLTQHNNWFAGLSTIFAAVGIGMFIFTEKKEKVSFVYLAFAALSIYVSFCTGARIAWVGNAVIILFYIVSLTFMKIKCYDKSFIKSYTLSFLIVLAVYIAVIALIASFRDTFSSGMNEFLRESTADFEEMGTKRGYIWKYGLESVPDNWLTGVGLDNYDYVFKSNPKWSEGMFHQAKGHNEYIHTLVTQGVFAVINYIALLAYSFFTGVKNVINTKDENHRRITWIFLGMLIGYAAQAFFNSSVINVAMYFWIIIGITMPKATQKPLNLDRFAKKSK